MVFNILLKKTQFYISQKKSGLVKNVLAECMIEELTGVIAMQHVNKAGQSKLLKKCTLPLTGIHCVKKIVTELAVIDVVEGGFKLIERAPGVTIEEIIKATEGNLIIEGEIPEMLL